MSEAIAPPRVEPDHRGLALSGGGFRATLFQLGAVERLLLLGVLDPLRYLGGVSAGAFLGGLLPLVWERLLAAGDRAAAFDELVARPILDLVASDVRDRALRRRVWDRGRSPGETLAAILDERLYHGARLGELPAPTRLRVSLNAVSLFTGKRFRFSRDTIGDYRVGYAAAPELKIADAVAASAAFPLLFAPFVVRFRPTHRWTFDEPAQLVALDEAEHELALADGGLYDNTSLVGASARCGEIVCLEAGFPLDLHAPVEGRVGSALRAIDITMSRLTAQTEARFVAELQARTRRGVLVRSTNRGAVGEEDARLLARLRTDVDVFSPTETALLRDHGRHVVDELVRRHQPTWVTREAPPLAAMALDDATRAELSAGARRRWRSLLKLLD